MSLAGNIIRNKGEDNTGIVQQSSGLFPADAAARSGSERFGRQSSVCGVLRLSTVSGVPEMVGHLHLQAMDDSLKGKNREGLLDSPDSGLPPSPSPPFCSLSPGLLESRSGSCTTPVESHHGYDRKESREGKLLPYLLLNATGADPKTRMYPVFFGESIKVKPNPEQEIKCSSVVKYDSDKHYQDQVSCAPVPTATSFSETVVAVHNCTWRSYRSQVYLEPRQKPVSYRSTTIIYPKHAKNTYRTTLSYNPAGSHRWFVSTVQLESSEDSSPCIIYTEDL